MKIDGHKIISILMQDCGNLSALAMKLPQSYINSLRPRQMDAISQTTFSNAFS